MSYIDKIITAKVAKQDVFKKIRKTVAIALLRGDTRLDQIENASPAGREIQEIINFWGIRVRKSARERLNLSSDSLTFSRFLASFPQFASWFVMTNGPKLASKLPGPDLTRFPAQTRRLPAAMHHSGFAALIPNSVAIPNFSKLLKTAHLAFMTEFGRVIHPGNNKTFTAGFEGQMNFANAAIRHDMPDEVRLEFLVGFGLDLWVNVNLMIHVCNDAMKAMNQSPGFGIEAFTVVGSHIKVVEDDAMNNKLIAEAG